MLNEHAFTEKPTKPKIVHVRECDNFSTNRKASLLTRLGVLLFASRDTQVLRNDLAIQHDQIAELTADLETVRSSVRDADRQLDEERETTKALERELDIERAKVEVLESQNEFLWSCREREMTRVASETAQLARAMADAENAGAPLQQVDEETEG